jgi:hypothetical protein
LNSFLFLHLGGFCEAWSLHIFFCL